MCEPCNHLILFKMTRANAKWNKKAWVSDVCAWLGWLCSMLDAFESIKMYWTWRVERAAFHWKLSGCLSHYYFGFSRMYATTSWRADRGKTGEKWIKFTKGINEKLAMHASNLSFSIQNVKKTLDIKRTFSLRIAKFCLMLIDQKYFVWNVESF